MEMMPWLGASLPQHDTAEDLRRTRAERRAGSSLSQDIDSNRRRPVIAVHGAGLQLVISTPYAGAEGVGEEEEGREEERCWVAARPARLQRMSTPATPCQSDRGFCVCISREQAQFGGFLQPCLQVWLDPSSRRAGGRCHMPSRVRA
jgi:hypothetical protein